MKANVQLVGGIIAIDIIKWNTRRVKQVKNPVILVYPVQSTRTGVKVIKKDEKYVKEPMIPVIVQIRGHRTRISFIMLRQAF
jgi:hypothetical protein